MAKNRNTTLAEQAIDKHLFYPLGVDLGRKSSYATYCLMEPTRKYMLQKELYLKKCSLVEEKYGDTLKCDEELDRLERYEKPRPHFRITDQERMEVVPELPHFHTIARFLRTMLESEKLDGRAAMCVDAGGIGDVVSEELHEAGVENFTRVITGHYDGQRSFTNGKPKFAIVVAKATLIGNLSLAFENGLVSFNPGVKYAREFEDELGGFHYHTTPAGNETYRTRTGAYDDLISAAAFAYYKALDIEKFNQPDEAVNALVSTAKDLPFERPTGEQIFKLGKSPPMP